MSKEKKRRRFRKIGKLLGVDLSLTKRIQTFYCISRIAQRDFLFTATIRAPNWFFTLLHSTLAVCLALLKHPTGKRANQASFHELHFCMTESEALFCGSLLVRERKFARFKAKHRQFSRNHAQFQTIQKQMSRTCEKTENSRKRSVGRVEMRAEGKTHGENYAFVKILQWNFLKVASCASCETFCK